MPKEKRTKKEFYSAIAKEFSSAIRTDNGVLMCKICETQIKAEQRSQVLQHFKTEKHGRESSLNKSKSQQLLPNIVSTQTVGNDRFTSSMELCDALVSGKNMKFYILIPDTADFLKHR